MPANPYWIGANLTCSLRFGLCPWRSSAPAAAYRRESRWSRWLPGVQWAWKLLRCNELCIYCNGKLTGCGSSCCDPRRGSASFFSFFQPVKILCDAHKWNFPVERYWSSVAEADCRSYFLTRKVPTEIQSDASSGSQRINAAVHSCATAPGSHGIHYTQTSKHIKYMPDLDKNQHFNRISRHFR